MFSSSGYLRVHVRNRVAGSGRPHPTSPRRKARQKKYETEGEKPAYHCCHPECYFKILKGGSSGLKRHMEVAHGSDSWMLPIYTNAMCTRRFRPEDPRCLICLRRQRLELPFGSDV